MRRIALLTVLLAGSVLARAGDIYCEKNLHDCSDRPRPGAQRLGTSTPPRMPTDNTPAAAGTSNAAGARIDDKHAGGDPVAAQKAANAERAVVQKDLTAKRTEQCKAAREQYQASIDARRMYRTNKNGDREYLTDAESDTARLKAHQAVSDLCGGK